MHSASVPDAFLDSFIGTNDEVKKRCLSPLDFGGDLDNEMNDVPLQDMYNRGLVLTQEGRERTHLQIRRRWRSRVWQRAAAAVDARCHRAHVVGRY